MHSPKQEKTKFTTDVNWSLSEIDKLEKGYEITDLEYLQRNKARNYVDVSDLDERKSSAEKGGYGEEKKVGPYGEEKEVGPYREEKEINAYGGENPKRTQSVTNLKVIKGRNWNSEIQILFEKREKDKTIRDKLETRAKFGQIAKEFTETAQKDGRIIIEERNLEDSLKTIKPISLGGYAGGKKYIYNGIFYKVTFAYFMTRQFATDEFNIFGDMEYAMKAAGHDKKGLQLFLDLSFYHQIPLRVPLMILIDHLGYRLIATTCLPINSTTILYGSNDAGQSVHAGTEEVIQAMEKVSKQLNLKPHFLTPFDGNFSKVLMHACGDMEVHKASDGRLYVLDTHRVMPPMKPDPKNKKTCFYRLFRPEFVADYRKPLCSDGFCKWNSGDDADLAEATEYFENTHIPEVAKKADIEFGYAQTVEELDIREVMVYVHRAGVNFRYLGLLRKHLKNKPLSELLLTELIARTVKNLLRKKWRGISYSKEESPNKFIARFFSKVFGKGEATETYWKKKLKKAIKQRFISAKVRKNLLSTVDTSDVLKRVLVLTGITIAPVSIQKLKDGTKLEPGDIQSVDPIVKQTHIVPYFNGFIQYEEGRKRINLIKKKELYKASIDAYLDALNSATKDWVTLNNLGIAYHELGVAQHVCGDFMDSKRNLQRSKRAFEKVEITDQNRDTVLTNWGVVLQNEATFCVDASDKDGKIKQAALFQEATEKLGAAKNTKLTPPKSKLIPVFQKKKLSLILVGNAGVGKTSLFKRFAKDEFSEVPSHVVETMNVQVEVDQTYVNLELIDTAGQEKFRTITSSFYSKGQIIGIVFDVNNEKSLDDVIGWHSDVVKFSSTYHLCLIGTKSDLGRNEKIIDKASRIANRMGCPTYFFITSAKSGENLDKPFQAMISLALHSKQTIQRTIPSSKSPPLKMHIELGSSKRPKSALQERLGKKVDPHPESFELEEDQ